MKFSTSMLLAALALGLYLPSHRSAAQGLDWSNGVCFEDGVWFPARSPNQCVSEDKANGQSLLPPGFEAPPLNDPGATSTGIPQPRWLFIGLHSQRESYVREGAGRAGIVGSQGNRLAISGGIAYLELIVSGVCVMPRSPSIVPQSDDHDVYLVLDDFGKLGRCWRETDEERTDRRTVVGDLLDGQYNRAMRVIAFNAAEGWARDVSEDVADELLQRLSSNDDEIPASLADFIDRHRSPAADQLPLPLRDAA